MSTFYYIFPSLLLYIVDLILRLIYTTDAIYSKLKVVGFNRTSSVLIEITVTKEIKTYPGCYFFLCFYKDISQFQWHPLSMVSNNNNTLVFCVKNNGPNSWSGRLKNITKIERHNLLINRKVYLQGPYGNITIDYKKNIYENIIIISGGIGITPMISKLEDINNLYNWNKIDNINKVYFVWILNNISLISTFEKYFRHLNNKIFDITIFITNNNIDTCEENITSNLFSIIYKKPDIVKIINKFAENIDNSKIAVINCGPNNLHIQIKNICQKLNIDISSEVFN